MDAVGAPRTTATIVLADDHELVRRGVRVLFSAEFQVVAEAGDGFEAVRLVDRWSPDVLIADITMPGLDGLAVTRRVARRSPRTKVVILSMHDDEARALEALRLGALAYVLKQSVADDLVTAVRTALEGRHYLSPPLSARVLEAYAARINGRSCDPYDALTPREREVLHLVASGLTYAGVAIRLGISVRTAEAHAANTMRKLGLRTQAELVKYAVQRGLVS